MIPATGRRPGGNCCALPGPAAVGGVLVGSCIPDSSPLGRAIDSLPINDKVQHVSVYLLLAFLPALHESRRAALGIGFGLILLGVALEGVQLPSEGRHFSGRTCWRMPSA